MKTPLSRRSFLSIAAAAGLVKASQASPVIDTHLEVWTFDPKFPFNHPERSAKSRTSPRVTMS